MGPVVDLGLASRQVEGGHLVLHTDVDPHGPELFRRPGDELVKIADQAPHDVGDAARRITGPAPGFDGHDLQVRDATANLSGRGHSSGVGSDDE